MRGFIGVAIAIAVLSGSSLVEAQATGTEKTQQKQSLPTGAKWLPRQQVINRYGRTSKSAFKRAPQIVSGMKKLDPHWDKDAFFGEDENQVLRLKSGRDILIISGRSVGICDGFPAVIAFDTRSKSAAMLTYYREMESVPEVPVNGTFSYETSNLLPNEEMFPILWMAIRNVQIPSFSGRLPSACNSINDDPDPDPALE